MSAPTFRVDIVTLNGKVYTGEAESIVATGARGYFGVLANHAPLITICAPGNLKIREKTGVEVRFQTGSGFFEVAKNRAVLLTDEAKPISA